MNRLFAPTDFFTVPDGTILAHVINTRDLQQETGLAETGSLSIAHGRIEPGVTSEIHVLPMVDQVTYVLSGAIRISMQDSPDRAVYAQEFGAQQASLCRAGTALQFHNAGDVVAEVLYIVSPAYVFEEEDEGIRFEDAVLVGSRFDEAFEERFTEVSSDAFKDDFARQRQASIDRILQQSIN